MDITPYLDTLLLLLVTAAAIKDLESRRIPNLLLLAGVLGGLLLHLLSPQPVTALLGALGGCATGLAVLLPFYLLRGMAAGDVKMMAAVGVFTGAGDALRIAVLAWCAGGVMVLVFLIVKGRLRLALANLWGMLLPMPAAPAAFAIRGPGRPAQRRIDSVWPGHRSRDDRASGRPLRFAAPGVSAGCALVRHQVP